MSSAHARWTPVREWAAAGERCGQALDKAVLSEQRTLGVGWKAEEELVRISATAGHRYSRFLRPPKCLSNKKKLSGVRNFAFTIGKPKLSEIPIPIL
jgi:hypothetical protein